MHPAKKDRNTTTIPQRQTFFNKVFFICPSFLILTGFSFFLVFCSVTPILRISNCCAISKVKQCPHPKFLEDRTAECRPERNYVIVKTLGSELPRLC
jgi:hypothetical protein